MATAVSIPPPPRSIGDADADMVAYANWFYRFYVAAVKEGGLLRADQQSVTSAIDPTAPPMPGTTTLATAQLTANTALVSATATAALFPALPGSALKVPRINAAAAAFEYITTAALVADGGGVPGSRTLNAGSGLTGGGNLTADRTFAVDFAAVVPSGRTVGAGLGLTGGGTLAANRTLAVDFTAVVSTARTVTVGTGLTGGGPLTGNITIALQTDWGSV